LSPSLAICQGEVFQRAKIGDFGTLVSFEWSAGVTDTDIKGRLASKHFTFLATEVF
jgi:hypothetical protein